MRDYVRGLLGQTTRKNGWQLAEWAGHRTIDELIDEAPCLTAAVVR